MTIIRGSIFSQHDAYSAMCEIEATAPPFRAVRASPFDREYWADDPKGITTLNAVI